MSNEIDASSIKLYVKTGGVGNYALNSSLVPLTLTSRAGVKPTELMFRELPAAVPGDATGPNTLSSTLSHGQRIITVVDGTTSKCEFKGWLVRRQDQHKANSVLWTAYDDRYLLKFIPVRGCLIRDIDDPATLRYSSVHPTFFNPKGAWNCTGFTIDGTTYPVFTPTAYYAKAYEAPNEAHIDALPTDGKPCAWTPRRALQYLTLLANLRTYATTIWPIDCLEPGYLPTLDADYLTFDFASMTALQGYDPALSTTDPLDRKLTALNVQADTCLGALDRILKSAGTHTFRLTYGDFFPDTPALTPDESSVFFVPIGWSATVGGGKSIDLQTGGNAAIEYGKCIDFDMMEDSTETCDLVVVEGQPVKVESRLVWNGTASTSSIVPAWSSAEETAFKYIIHGAAAAETDIAEFAYAQIPNVQGSTTTANYVPANPAVTTDAPLVYAHSDEAIALARENFPTVYRAFVTNTSSDMASALGTAGTGYLRAPRPIYPNQLQYHLTNSQIYGSTTEAARLRSTLPIRVEIQFPNSGEWVQVPRDVGIKVTTDEKGEALIWLEGLAESADGQFICLYSGNLWNPDDYSNGYINLRNIRINCAFPSDHRVTGTATVASATPTISTEFAGAYDTSRTEARVKYYDAGDSFFEGQQYKSYPALSQKYYGGTAGTTEQGDFTDGLTRALPPGSEQPHADYAAERMMASLKNIRRTSSWVQAGIQYAIYAGDFVERIYIYNGTGYSTYYLNGIVGETTFDYLEQKTVVGNVISEFY